MQRPRVVQLAQSQPAVLLGHLHAQRPEILQPLDELVGYPRLAFDRRGIDLRLEECPQSVQELLALFFVVRSGTGMRMNQIQSQPAQEQFLGEARLAPLGLAGRLGDRP